MRKQAERKLPDVQELITRASVTMVPQKVHLSWCDQMQEEQNPLQNQGSNQPKATEEIDQKDKMIKSLCPRL